MRTAGQDSSTREASPRIIAKVTTSPLVPPGTPTAAAGEPLLLSSKLTVPDPPATMVERPRLIETLRAGANRAVTLLVAPAGWGKTALLSSWIAEHAPKRTSWLTVEATDDAPTFWSYLAAAVTAHLPARLRAPAVADDTFLARLAATLAALPDPVVVVLDDFHLMADPSVPRGLEFLLRHSKGRLRLVIAARSAPDLPLHRWRLTGDLTELRAADLAFTREETAELLRRHGLELSESFVRDVHARAEGWPAGLRLAALALRDNPAHRTATVTGDLPAIAEYLAAELLAPLPTELRDLLRRTAVLERFCASSADALTGGHDSDRLLAAVAEEARGFLVPIDGQPGWYRCHRLLGDHLYSELCRQHPTDVAGLHRRAAHWYGEHGMPVAAVRHALAARDWAAAAARMTDIWPYVVICGHDETLRTPLAAPPAEVVRGYPLLAVAYAADRIDIGDYDGALEHLRHAQRHLHADGETTMTSALAAVQLVNATLAGELPEAVRAAEEVSARAALTPEPVATYLRVIAATALGEARFAHGDLSGARRACVEAVTAAAASGWSCAERRARGWLALVDAVAGDLTRAEEAARGALAGEPCPGRRCVGHAAAAHLALAWIAQDRERRADADRELARAAELATSPVLTTAIALVRARAVAAEDLDRARELLVAARRRRPEAWRGNHLDTSLIATEAQVRVAHGDVDTARELLTDALAHHPRPELAVALAQLHVRAGDPAAAVAALPDGASGDTVALPTRLAAITTEAAARSALGERRRAHQLLEEALDLASAHGGHRRVFTQGGAEVRALLADHLDTGTAHRATVTEILDSTAPDKEERTAPPGLTEPLTERELTILRYLQSSLSNGEIAAELFLSVNTVKTHVRNIYQKLGAPRRRDAVRRARELRLL